MTVRNLIMQALPGKTHPTFGAVEPFGVPHWRVPRAGTIAFGLRGDVLGIHPFT
jgi:hypothetical protein